MKTCKLFQTKVFHIQQNERSSRSSRFGAMARLASVSLLLLAGQAFAQFSASIQGTVTDASGAVVPNATVLVTNTETGVKSNAATNNSGQYRVNSLAPGNYRIHVASSGFGEKDVTATITTAQDAGVDVTLSVESNNQTVTVSSEAVGLNPEETRVQTTLDTQQVRDLPLQQRGTLGLVNTAPGVSGYTENLNNFAVEQTPGGNANGHYYGGNLYVLDGVSITSNITTGTANISPNADSIQEVTLQVNTFRMDFAGGSGLTTEVTTKSGTNAFHGTGNFTYTDQNLRVARSEFNPALPKFSNKDASGTFGGPIFKDKTFFFASVEKLANKSASTGQFSVEDPAFVSYAQRAFPNTLGTSFLTKYPVTSNARRTGVLLYGTPDFVTQTCAKPVGNCTTPFIDSASSQTSPYQDGLQYSARGDQYLRGGNDRIYGYYYNIKLDSQVIDPRQGFTFVNPNRSWYTSMNYTHTFSPKLLNQAQFAAFKVEGASPGTDPKIPFIHVNNQQSVTQFGGGWGPGSFIQHNYSWRDVVSYVQGKHNLRVGVRVEHGDDSANFGGGNGRPNFGFQSLTDLIQDRVYDEGNLSYDPLTGKFKPLQFGVQGTNYGVFAEDQWKLKPNLSLTLGIRYDDFGNPYTYGYDTYTKIANVFPAGNTTTLQGGAALDAQIANAFVKQTNNAYTNRQNVNFSPRVAFSYQPDKAGKIVIHGGVGMYRDIITLGQVVDGLRGNPPGWVFPTFSPQNGTTPLLSLGTSNVLPYGYTVPAIPATGLDSRGGVPGSGSGVTGLDANVKIPKTLNYTLGVTTELPGHMVVGVNGVGSYAYDQLSGTDFNRVAGDLIRNNGKLVRLNPSFTNVTYVSNLNTSYYNGVVFTMTQRLNKLTYQASYTWSHALDYGTCGTRFDFNNFGNGGQLDCPVDQHNFGANYGNSAFDVRNNFKFSGSYTLPTPHVQPIADRVLGGWEVASIATAQSGTPFSPTNYNVFNSVSNAPNCTGVLVTCGDYNGDGYNNDRPNLVAGTRLSGFSRAQYKAGIIPTTNVTFTDPKTGITATDPKTGIPLQFAVPVGLSAPAPGTVGNLGRNVFRNPGLLAIDASVLKNTFLPWFGSEHSNLQLRVDFFNVLNRVNFRNVDYNVGSNTFGRSTDTFQPRTIQLGGRFQF